MILLIVHFTLKIVFRRSRNDLSDVWITPKRCVTDELPDIVILIFSIVNIRLLFPAKRSVILRVDR
jgi:hypothetical protein